MAETQNEEDKTMNTIKYIINGAHGVYVPQTFAEQSIGWQGIDPDYLAILRQGPHHADYWEAWDAVLSSASYTDDDGHTWTLHLGENGDLFAVRDDHEFED